MENDWRKRLRIVLIMLLVLTAIRAGYLFYLRREASAPAPKKETYSANLDDYVTFPKIFPYDLKSAEKELAGKTVWVRAGNIVPFYPYSKSTRSADLKHRAGLLPPLKKFQISGVILQKVPASLAEGQVAVVQRQVLAVFADPAANREFAFSVGSEIGDNFTFTANDELFFADPHELYKHWPADVWTAIDHHEAKPGMSELQVAFALGAAGSIGSGDYGNRMIEYTNNDNPVKVTFQNNKAVTVTPEKK